MFKKHGKKLRLYRVERVQEVQSLEFRDCSIGFND